MKLEDDLNAEETSSEDEDELPEEGRGLKDLWEQDEGKESWDEDEDSNEDEHEQEGDGDDDDDEDENANRDEHDHDDDNDEDENEDEHEGDDDQDEMKRLSALFLQGQKKWQLDKTYKIWSIVSEIHAQNTAVANHHHLLSAVATKND